MRGKVVLITDGSSGIGEQIAYQCAKRGASLAPVARREQRLHQVEEKARDLGSPDIRVLVEDVSGTDDYKRFVQEAANHFGRLDHQVNNAGTICVCMLEETTDIPCFRKITDVNLRGYIYPTYHAIPHLKRTQGKIVVVSSTDGWLPVPRMSFCTATKAAVVSFYETLRVELGPDISIIIATPGWLNKR